MERLNQYWEKVCQIVESIDRSIGSLFIAKSVRDDEVEETMIMISGR